MHGSECQVAIVTTTPYIREKPTGFSQARNRLVTSLLQACEKLEIITGCMYNRVHGLQAYMKDLSPACHKVFCKGTQTIAQNKQKCTVRVNVHKCAK